MKILRFVFILAVLIATACQNRNNNQDSHNHEHDEVSLKFTQYNSEFELFAETQPLAKGQTSGILAHITRLSDFQPLNKGKVTASLIVGTKGIRQTLEKPTRPGIYLFELQPEATGKGKLIFDIETAKGKTTITINGVEVFADEHDAIHEAEHHTVDNPNAITFTKEQSWKIDFATGYPSLEPFGEVIKTTAHVQSAQIDENTIPAKTNGIVDIPKTLVEGSEVSKGKTILKISGANLSDNNMAVRFNEAKNNFEKAEANYKRAKSLAEDQIISQKELLDSKNEFENAMVLYESLKKNFNEKGQNVTSPINGFIRHMFVGTGQYVEAGEPLVSVVENKNLFLNAEVQQKYANVLPFIKTANIRSLSTREIYDLEEMNGKVVSFGKNVSDESYLIPVTLQVENRSGIVPGSFIELFLKTESNTDALIIPNEALIEEQGNFAVFVQLNPESFEKREVKIGKSDGRNTEITDGLSPTERIVTRGGILVKLAAVSNSLDPHAGHVH